MAACPPQASSQLMSAIRSAASALGSEPWHGPLRHHRGRIIVILARQLADANKRLGSSYWTGPDGHNVGLDVFKAYGIALAVAGRARSLDELKATMTAAAAAYRERPGDPDGYGSATFGEIERDLKALSDPPESPVHRALRLKQEAIAAREKPPRGGRFQREQAARIATGKSKPWMSR